MRRLSKWLIGALMLLMSLPADATHYMGGEITWECTPNGDFRFIMKLYRECYITNGSAAANFANTETMNTTVPGFPSITMTRVTGWPVDISPVCNNNPSFPHITCTGMVPPGNANMGAVQEHIYTSDVSYPNGVPLTGVPPVTGWVFSHSSCCRNPCTNIVGSNGMNWYLRAIMYPYNNQNVSTCYDNSPKFQEIPRTVICTGYPFTYNHNASDKELDSLKYEWAQPWSGNNQPITAFSPGYTWSSPLPGTLQNPNNSPAAINQFTGEISFTSYTNGAFVTVTKVTAYKCGIKVAEIFREMQVVLLQCGTNTPPDVTPPFQNALGQYTDFSDTVYAGEFVTFALSGTDFEFLPNSQPQTMTMRASGLQFGTNYTNSTAGCLNPPCATLTPPPPVTGIFGVQTTFNWQTDCQHLATNIGCGTTSNLYTFVIRTQDDYCPAPAINIATITILVLDHPQLPTPDLGCTEVLSNGSVRLTWEEVIDTFGTFNAYFIYHSTTPTGPFTVLDSIFNISTTTYIHNGANANSQVNYYYFRTRSGCNADKLSLPKDTIATILLDVVNPGAAFGVADLSWNPPANPLLPGMSGVYEVYREYPAGIWTMIGTTPTTTYQDVITFCSQFINYRIEMVDTFSYDTGGIPMTCRIISSVDGDLFNDVTPPATPILDSVTVDPVSSQAFLSWDVNPSGDTEGYIVYRLTGGVWQPVDTVWGLNSHTWFDLTGNPCTQSESYTVAAFDSCGNTSPMALELKTIYTTLSVDPCQDEIAISWTDYINMNPALTDYEIWVSENGALPTLIATNPAATLTYQHVGLNSGSQYCYYIHAVNGGTSSSTSCVACINMVKPNQPQYAYLRTATVVNDAFVQLKAHIDDQPPIQEYRILRSLTGAPGTFTQIGAVNPPGGQFLSFNDLSANFRNNSNYYMFVVVDSCGVEALESNVARTILLQLTPDLTSKMNVLTWNDYEGWDPAPVGPSGTPTEYWVYRIVDGGLPVAVAPLIPGTGTYTDDVASFAVGGGDFDYYVDAYEGPGNVYSFADSSRSNMMQALHPPKLYVPNVFTPNGDGLNDLFMPQTTFIPGQDYELMIYNRWGQLLWMTKDKTQGWDGKVDGQLAPAGAYVYMIRFKTSNGEPFERQGTFILKP